MEEDLKFFIKASIMNISLVACTGVELEGMEHAPKSTL